MLRSIWRQFSFKVIIGLNPSGLIRHSSTMELTWPKAILFGDSLIQRSFDIQDGCWASILTDRLQRRCDVVPRGLSGYNTRYCRMVLPRVIKPQDAAHVSIFMIFLGANDSNSNLNVLQHVPPSEYKDNLVKMVEYIQSIGISKDKIVLLGPPPCDVVAWKAVCTERGNEMTKDNAVIQQYSSGCEEAAQQTGVQFIELYNAMMKQENWKSLLCDGLHFSLAGSRFLAEMLWPWFEKKTAHLPFLLPLLDEIDPHNPEKSLTPSTQQETNT